MFSGDDLWKTMKYKRSKANIPFTRHFRYTNRTRCTSRVATVWFFSPMSTHGWLSPCVISMYSNFAICGHGIFADSLDPRWGCESKHKREDMHHRITHYFMKIVVPPTRWAPCKVKSYRRHPPAGLRMKQGLGTCQLVWHRHPAVHHKARLVGTHQLDSQAMKGAGGGGGGTDFLSWLPYTIIPLKKSL